MIVTFAQLSRKYEESCTVKQVFNTIAIFFISGKFYLKMTTFTAKTKLMFIFQRQPR